MLVRSCSIERFLLRRNRNGIGVDDLHIRVLFTSGEVFEHERERHGDHGTSEGADRKHPDVFPDAVRRNRGRGALASTNGRDDRRTERSGRIYAASIDRHQHTVANVYRETDRDRALGAVRLCVRMNRNLEHDDAQQCRHDGFAEPSLRGRGFGADQVASNAAKTTIIFGAFDQEGEEPARKGRANELRDGIRRELRPGQVVIQRQGKTDGWIDLRAAVVRERVHQSRNCDPKRPRNLLRIARIVHHRPHAREHEQKHGQSLRRGGLIIQGSRRSIGKSKPERARSLSHRLHLFKHILLALIAHGRRRTSYVPRRRRRMPRAIDRSRVESIPPRHVGWARGILYFSFLSNL
jgi:hypothetical protein